MDNKLRRLAIASDHAGFELKSILIDYLKQKGYQVEDFGTHSTESMDYPDAAHPFAKSVNTGKNELGIIICGSGNGVNMVVNKYPNVRGALCWTPEIATLAREHNDANVLSLGARLISVDVAKEIVDCFLKTDFLGGRHANRVNKIAACE